MFSTKRLWTFCYKSFLCGGRTSLEAPIPKGRPVDQEYCDLDMCLTFRSLVSRSVPLLKHHFLTLIQLCAYQTFGQWYLVGFCKCKFTSSLIEWASVLDLRKKLRFYEQLVGEFNGRCYQSHLSGDKLTQAPSFCRRWILILSREIQKCRLWGYCCAIACLCTHIIPKCTKIWMSIACRVDLVSLNSAKWEGKPLHIVNL